MLFYSRVFLNSSFSILGTKSLCQTRRKQVSPKWHLSKRGRLILEIMLTTDLPSQFWVLVAQIFWHMCLGICTRIFPRVLHIWMSFMANCFCLMNVHTRYQHSGRQPSMFCRTLSTGWHGYLALRNCWMCLPTLWGCESAPSFVLPLPVYFKSIFFTLSWLSLLISNIPQCFLKIFYITSSWPNHTFLSYRIASHRAVYGITSQLDELQNVAKVRFGAKETSKALDLNGDILALRTWYLVSF